MFFFKVFIILFGNTINGFFSVLCSFNLQGMLYNLQEKKMKKIENEQVMTFSKSFSLSVATLYFDKTYLSSSSNESLKISRIDQGSTVAVH